MPSWDEKLVALRKQWQDAAERCVASHDELKRYVVEVSGDPNVNWISSARSQSGAFRTCVRCEPSRRQQFPAHVAQQRRRRSLIARSLVSTS